MVQLITNVPQYENDIAEEIRLFLGAVEIRSDAADPDLVMTVSLQEEDLYASGTLGKATAGFAVLPDGGDLLERKRQQKRAVKRVAFALLMQAFPMDMPWGSLTGIRPTKLLRELADRYGAEEAVRQFREVFSVSEEKLRLAATINAVQKPYLESVGPRDLDVYVGIPYCRTRCLYCSFGAEIARGASVEGYLAPLFEDIERGGKIAAEGGWHHRATYIGGGTPTVLNADQLDRLLTHFESVYGGYGTECTVEAGRPDTITKEKLAVLKAHGIGRISINPQTMNDETLRRIGRAHTAAEIRETYALARAVGFDSINMDLIAGLPGEDENDFARTLEEIIALRPDNLTVHTLAVKRSSRLKEQLERYPLPSKESVTHMIDMGFDAAKRIGLWPYYMYRQKYQNGNLENVGYAGRETICMYNIDMMEETTSILAHGANAMTKRIFNAERRVERIAAPKDVPTYANKLDALDRQKRALLLC
ncbi:MAG: coproporphyrinogen dehydrogenase HemZ [Clostridia bacterium]|nr:coproporphyrinogen dehydrogenase HemZ [Clostridia bacterium]